MKPQPSLSNSTRSPPQIIRPSLISDKLKAFEINPTIISSSPKGSCRSEYQPEQKSGTNGSPKANSNVRSNALDTTKIKLEGEIISLGIKIDFLEKENTKLKLSRCF